MKIQSYTDIITNSSSEVFVRADDADSVKRIIDAVLAAANSDYTCDDLFEITIEYDDYCIKAKDSTNNEHALTIGALIGTLYLYDSYYS